MRQGTRPAAVLEGAVDVEGRFATIEQVTPNESLAKYQRLLRSWIRSRTVVTTVRPQAERALRVCNDSNRLDPSKSRCGAMPIYQLW